jgi:hypothetical protein
VPTLARIDSDTLVGQITEIFQGDGPIDHWSAIGPAVVIDGMNPMPGVGWTTSDGGQTFVPPAADSVIGNRAALQVKAIQALQSNIDYLAITTPSQVQVLTQVNRLTRQTSGIIRLLLNELDSQTGT